MKILAVLNKERRYELQNIDYDLMKKNEIEVIIEDCLFNQDKLSISVSSNQTLTFSEENIKKNWRNIIMDCSLIDYENSDEYSAQKSACLIKIYN
jgi:hypothetical protein